MQQDKRRGCRMEGERCAQTHLASRVALAMRNGSAMCQAEAPSPKRSVKTQKGWYAQLVYRRWRL